MNQKKKSKQNRNTTYESLLGVVGILLADDEQTFIAAYRQATNDSKGSGHGAWVLVEEGVEKKREQYNRYMRNRMRKQKQKV